MRRGRKILLAIVGALLLAIGGVVAGSYWWLDSVAKQAIEVQGSDALGVTVELDSIRIGVMSGEARLKALTVANPPGCTKEQLFTLGEGTVELTVRSLMEDTIVIPRIELDSLDVNLEPVENGKYNSEIILENIARSLESATAREDETEKKIKVEYLVVRNIRVHYKTEMWIAVPILIDKIEMRDIGSDGSGVNMEELSSIVTAGIFAGIWREGAGKLPRAILEGLGTGLKALGGGALKGVKIVGDVAGGAVKAVGKGITDLFGGR